jgi:peptide/nickel transport system permease protein
MRTITSKVGTPGGAQGVPTAPEEPPKGTEKNPTGAECSVSVFRSPGRAVRSVLLGRYPFAEKAAAVVLALVLVFSVVGLIWQPSDPYQTNPKDALLSPSFSHLLGTDNLGRDVLSRLLAGAAETILAAVVITALAAIIGIAAASVAAMAPRFIDSAIMRLCDVVLALPTLILALAIAAVLGPSTRSLIIAMVLSLWPGIAKLARTMIRETMTHGYVENAKRMGMRWPSVLRRHVLPNSLDPIIVTASMEVGGCIVIMAGLSFIGAGAPPPNANWGNLIAQGESYITTAWWISFFPGLLITLAAASFGLLGEAARARLVKEDS